MLLVMFIQVLDDAHKILATDNKNAGIDERHSAEDMDLQIANVFQEEEQWTQRLEEAYNKRIISLNEKLASGRQRLADYFDQKRNEILKRKTVN